MLVWLCSRWGGGGGAEGGVTTFRALLLSSHNFLTLLPGGCYFWNFLVPMVLSNKVVLSSIKGWFPSHCNPSSTSSQIHTANQLPTIFIGNVLLKSVQKPFSIITSDHVKFTTEDSGTESTSPVYQRGNNCPFIRRWIITFYAV